jgi:HAMP domain-containing protein
MRAQPRIRLTGFIVMFCCLMTVLTWGVTMALVLRVSQGVTERQNNAILRNRGQIASAELARFLQGEWSRLRSIESFIAKGEDLGVLRRRFDTIKVTNNEVAWLGFADTSGKVIVASEGILEGDSVSARPWFRGGIDGPFAGDKHEALLLARFLKANSSEPLRLIDLAMPVHQLDGSLAGVIGLHIDWYWVRDFIRSFGHDGVDVLLLSRQGYVLAGPKDVEGTKLITNSVMAAGQGAGVTQSETWPDGQRYLVTVLPIGSSPDLPSFGWSLLVRQHGDAGLAGARAVITQVLPILIVLGALLLLSAFLLGRALGRPLTRLTSAASAMALMQITAPVPDERRYREVAELASALSRLQSMVGQTKDSPPPVNDAPSTIISA